MKMTVAGRAVLSAAGFLVLLGGCSPGGEEGEEVQTAVAGPVRLRDVISQTGEVRAVVNIDLKCEASGKIDSVFVREGEPVTRGQKIIMIDPQRLQRRKQRLMLDVEESAIRLAIARRNVANAQALAAAGAVSRTRLEDLETERKLREIQHQQKQLEIEDINEELGKTLVTSPMDGVITTLSVEEGEIAVSATAGVQGGTQIATIADVNRLEVVSQIGEVDYVHLAKGQPVSIRPEALEGVRTRGTIEFISLTARKRGGDELGTFEVRIAVDSLVAGLVPGVNVNVEFVVLNDDVPVAVPVHFIHTTARGSRVTVQSAQGKRENRSVERGRTDYRFVEILAGLAAGETVVLDPSAPPGPGEEGGRRGRS